MTQHYAWIAWVIAVVAVLVSVITFVKSRRQGVVVRADTGVNAKIYMPTSTGYRDVTKLETAASSLTVARRRRAPEETRETVRIYVKATSPTIIDEAAVCASRWPLLRRRAPSLTEEIRQSETVLADGKQKTLVLKTRKGASLGDGPLMARIKTERRHHYYAPVKRLTGEEL